MICGKGPSMQRDIDRIPGLVPPSNIGFTSTQAASEHYVQSAEFGVLSASILVLLSLINVPSFIQRIHALLSALPTGLNFSFHRTIDPIKSKYTITVLRQPATN